MIVNTCSPSFHQSGKTPLMFAAANGLLDFVTLLLAHNADVAAEDEDRCTALHFAARNSAASHVSLDDTPFMCYLLA